MRHFCVAWSAGAAAPFCSEAFCEIGFRLPVSAAGRCRDLFREIEKRVDLTGVVTLIEIGKKTLRWNPELHEFANDQEANRLRSRENRAPWNNNV